MRLEDDVALAHALADAAAAVIRPLFRARLAVEEKADLSPVTAADRGAEAAIRSLLAEHRPHDGVLGEEHADRNAGAERLWVIDPIDGTRAFVAGRPLFGTLIALMEAGRPVLGVIDQCIIGDRWLGAAGQPTRFNGAVARTRACAGLAAARLGTTSPQAFAPGAFAAFERVRVRARDMLYGGDCHNYGLVASGHLDGVVEAGLKLHDWAALVPVIEGAGGCVTDWQGRPLVADGPGEVLALGDAKLLGEVTALLSDPGTSR